MTAGADTAAGVVARDTLSPSTASVRRARRIVADALARIGRHQHVDVAALLVSELVTNAVLHADGDLVLLVCVADGAVRVEVRDLSPALPVMRARSPEAETGRGMQLVEELADTWGVKPDDRGKVVWFELRDLPPAGPTVDALRELRDRAVVAADISFTISDPSQPDNPLVWVNPAFTRATGYTFDEVVGRNCRFLQGPATDPGAVDDIRAAIAQRRPATVTLLNYRRDGTAFWNELSLSPVFDGAGALTHFVGVQADVTARIQVEQEREAAHRAEREARAEAEAARAAAEVARSHMALLAEATRALSSTLDVDRALTRFIDVVVPGLGDFTILDLTDAGGVVRSYVRHVDRASEAHLRRLSAGYAARGLPRVASGPVLQADMRPGDAGWSALDDPERELHDLLAPRSGLVVPLRARGRLLGALTVATTAHSGRRLDDATLDLAVEAGQRAAQAVDLARLYRSEHDMVVALQRSLLPVLPEIDGVTMAARYLTATDGVDVGGDWYDVLALPDGGVGIAIGDVMGHDLAAAAAMGQFRSVLRSYAWEGNAPADVLDRMDRLVQGLGMAQLATAVYARLEADGDGERDLCWANAGHLVPIVHRAGGDVERLEEGASVLLGAVTGLPRDEGHTLLRPGDTLLLYTDGLVERRGLDLSIGIDRLEEVVRAHRAADGPDVLCDRIVERFQADRSPDDVALLAIQLG